MSTIIKYCSVIATITNHHVITILNTMIQRTLSQQNATQLQRSRCPHPSAHLTCRKIINERTDAERDFLNLRLEYSNYTRDGTCDPCKKSMILLLTDVCLNQLFVRLGHTFVRGLTRGKRMGDFPGGANDFLYM